ncbi:SAM-dependent methyltransferase [Streptomyces phaeochromogenes]|uniref:SAM-dependent methyltransferase n=1 Tax=Streptomyces phaeochromogenes TaxID=1923 RepID=UPI002E28DCFE|nr:SAM-dependent methyltransferase [Streptomyces phaeochromogenes]
MNHHHTPLSHTIDVTQPSVARMHNYYLGGKDNYPADRQVCERLLEHAPSTQILTINNRRFLKRVLRCLIIEHGVRQFLDIGAGLPTRDNVHEIAQRYTADARVVYVDNDPMVLAYGRVLLQDNDQTAVIQADLRHPDTILDHPQAADLFDLREPVAALCVSVLHCIPDDDAPAELVRRTAARLCPGSFLVISQLVSEDATTRRVITDFMRENTDGNWGAVRCSQDVDRFFTGLDILEPGLGDVSAWRTDARIGPRQRSREWIEYGGAGRVP